MRLDEFLIGLIIFSLFFGIGALLIHNATADYGLTYNESMFEGTTDESSDSVYDVMNETNSIVSGMQEKTFGGDSFISSVINAVDVIFSAAYTTLALVGNSFSLLFAIIQSIGSTIGIPPIVTNAIIIIFIISTVFTVIYLILKYK